MRLRLRALLLDRSDCSLFLRLLRNGDHAEGFGLFRGKLIISLRCISQLPTNDQRSSRFIYKNAVYLINDAIVMASLDLESSIAILSRR